MNEYVSVGLDVGYSAVKVAYAHSLNGEMSVFSQASIVIPDRHILGMKEGDYIVSLDGGRTKYIVGQLAAFHAPKIALAHGNRLFASDDAHILAAWVLAVVGGGKPLDIVASMPAEQYITSSAEYREKLMSLDGVEVCVWTSPDGPPVPVPLNIRNVKALPQGYLALFSDNSIDLAGDVCVVDPGQDTLSLVVTRDGRYIEKYSASHFGHGLTAMQDELCRMLRLRYGSAPENIVDTIIRRRFSGKDVSAEIESTYRWYVSSYLAPALKNQRITSDRYVFSGGAAHILAPLLTDLTKIEFRNVLGVHANAVGAMRIGMELFANAA